MVCLSIGSYQLAYFTDTQMFEFTLTAGETAPEPPEKITRAVWQKSIATSWVQQVNPFTLRSAWCLARPNAQIRYEESDEAVD